MANILIILDVFLNIEPKRIIKNLLLSELIYCLSLQMKLIVLYFITQNLFLSSFLNYANHRQRTDLLQIKSVIQLPFNLHSMLFHASYTKTFVFTWSWKTISVEYLTDVFPTWMNTLMKRERNIFRLVVLGRVSPYKTMEDFER